MQRILVIRFSSIGDIVLTTPVVRCIKKQLNAHVTFLTKKSFASILENNPYVDQVLTIDKDVNEISRLLTDGNFDFVVDLHKNLRSKKVIKKTGVAHASFQKLNIEKWLLVNLKINKMPDVHIVDRYFEAVAALGVKNDQEGLDYFLPEGTSVENLPEKFICFAIGGTYATKRSPVHKIIEIVNSSELPVVLIGGPDDLEAAIEIEKATNCINLVGKINLNQSAYVTKVAYKVITHDTGMMHIAAAFQKDIISIWGNTVPEFGMTPYLPGKNSVIIENKQVDCRPCSKLGYNKCPKKHFKCMNDIQVDPKLLV